MNARAANLGKSERGIESIRSRVRRLQIKLADGVIASNLDPAIEQIGVKPARAPHAACGRNGHDPVDKVAATSCSRPR